MSIFSHEKKFIVNHLLLFSFSTKRDAIIDKFIINSVEKASCHKTLAFLAVKDYGLQARDFCYNKRVAGQQNLHYLLPGSSLFWIV